MNGPNETGGAATPPEFTRHSMTGCIGRYHAPADPGKSFRFLVDDRPVRFRGKRAALLRALIAAGSEGVVHVECMPWLFDISAAVVALKAGRVRIATHRGKPTRWVLLSDVREVQP